MQALEAYKNDVGDFPAAETGLQSLAIDPGAPGWRGPYLRKSVPPDPWGNPYIYRRSNPTPEIISRGEACNGAISSVNLNAPIKRCASRLPQLALAALFFSLPFLPVALRVTSRAFPGTSSP